MQAAQKVTDQARKYRQYAQPILLSSIIVSPANYNMLRSHISIIILIYSNICQVPLLVRKITLFSLSTIVAASGPQIVWVLRSPSGKKIGTS